MYQNLESEYTKKRFLEILSETQKIAEVELSKHEYNSQGDIWVSIISQIKDIREKVVEKQLLTDWEDIYERYSIGSIGLQCFDEQDEMRSRLCDIFAGAVHYRELTD